MYLLSVVCSGGVRKVAVICCVAIVVFDVSSVNLLIHQSMPY